jgi:pilus assembly protein CpaF
VIARRRAVSTDIVAKELGYDSHRGEYLMQGIFARQYHATGEHGMIDSDIVPTGITPRCIPQWYG